MTTLTLIYAADTNGNFVDPETGKCWNIPDDREFFQKTIKGKSIICGLKTFENDYKGLVGAKGIAILVSPLRIPGGEFKTAKDFIYNKKGELRTRYPITYERPSILSALCDAQWGGDFEYKEEIICVGGKQTIEALAPFASKVLATEIDPSGSMFFEGYPQYLPEHIEGERGYIQEHGKAVWDNYTWLEEKGKHKRSSWRRIELNRFKPIEF